MAKKEVSAKNKARAAARLKALDAQYADKQDKVKRGQLRSQAAMGSRKVRNEAASKLANMPRKPKQQN